LNPGAAFSLLAQAAGWQRWFFGGIALITCIALIVLIVRKPPVTEALGLALILGGAAGNLTDRVVRGSVFDWLDFYWSGMHWPAFNMADVWIVSGVGLLLIASLRLDVTSAQTRG
jgi:signal peptidase II